MVGAKRPPFIQNSTFNIQNWAAPPPDSPTTDQGRPRSGQTAAPAARLPCLSFKIQHSTFKIGRRSRPPLRLRASAGEPHFPASARPMPARTRPPFIQNPTFNIQNWAAQRPRKFSFPPHFFLPIPPVHAILAPKTSHCHHAMPRPPPPFPPQPHPPIRHVPHPPART